MKLFFSDRQLAHQPEQYGKNGRIIDPLENPERARTLIKVLGDCGVSLTEPADFGKEPITAVHACHYVDFLETVYARFQQLPHAGPEVWPSVTPHHRSYVRQYAPGEPPPMVGTNGLVGWYFRGFSNAMGEHSYDAAYVSAQTAVAAARAVLDGAASAYALCRPPGHHAGVDSASGFCFFNNAAIAAQDLRRKFEKVAIIDFDTHHGDGTEDIFYRRGDVFFGSVHTDPASYYPWDLGYAHETGSGDGASANLNIPLPPGAGDAEFVAGVQKLADAALAHGAEAIVVSAGWDAHHEDPLQKNDPSAQSKVTTAAFARVGEICAALGKPTVIVQEGGYSIPAIAEAAPAFFKAFMANHRPALSRA